MKHETALPIGTGGMGEVFKAWDPDLERFVALKYLRHDDPVLVERLMREARAQARIDHPSVCKVFEVGVEDGRPFIAMEYVDGRPLDEAAAELSLEHRVVLLKKVAEAVQAAHEAGLIHRDLKPGNILVCDRDGLPHPYVLDFGIARHVEDVAGLTITGQIMGTPGYMSPEQACGDVANLDRRTDVFSLGAILYELLAGSRPFECDSTVEFLVHVLEDDPKPLRALAPHLPRDLETVVMTCLQKEPERRYGSARELAEDLDRFLRGEPVLARRTGVLTRVRLKARRHPRVAVAAVAAVAAVLVLTGIAARERLSAARRAAIAQELGREVERMEGSLERAYLLPLHDIRPTQAQVRSRMAAIDARLGGLDRPSRSTANFAIGRGHLALGEAPQALERLRRAWDLGDRSPDLAYALGLSLAELYRDGLAEADGIRDPERRAAAVTRVTQTYREPARRFLELSRGSTGHPAYLAATLAWIAGERDRALAELAELADADPFFYMGDLLAGSIHRRTFEDASRSGDAPASAVAFADAEAAFKAAARVGESDPRPYVQLCGLWVGALRNQFWESGGDLRPARDAALGACNQALTADPGLAAAHVESGRAHRYWAEHEMYQGREDPAALAAARRHAEAAIETDPGNAAAHVLLGVTYRIAAQLLANSGGDPRNELLGAVTAYRKAIRLEPSDAGAHISLANALLTLGDHARSQGRRSDEFFRDAAESATRALDLEPGNVGASVNLGIAHAQLAVSARDRGDDAGQHFERAVAAYERAIELNPGFFTAHFNLGETLLDESAWVLGRGLDPEALLGRSLELLSDAAAGYPTWAAPHYLQAEAHALAAEYRRLVGGDPAADLAAARRAITVGKNVNPADAVGLNRASMAYLVEARWLAGKGLDPAPALTDGLATVTAALTANPALAAAHARRAELLLVRAEWQLDRGRSPEDDLDEAERALEAAAEVNGADAAVPTSRAILSRLRAAWLQHTGADAAEEIAAGLVAVDRALALDPLRAAAMAERAALENLAGRHDAARVAAAAAHRIDPLVELPVGLGAAGS